MFSKLLRFLTFFEKNIEGNPQHHKFLHVTITLLLHYYTIQDRVFYAPLNT